jgi:hypothetical protein
VAVWMEISIGSGASPLSEIGWLKGRGWPMGEQIGGANSILTMRL